MGKHYHAQGAGESFSTANNRPAAGVWGRITAPMELEKDVLQLSTDQKQGIWGRITTPRELEKDFLQLTTARKKAYGEGLPRQGGWTKTFFS